MRKTLKSKAEKTAEYLLSRAPNETVRLQNWAESWEPETEAMLDAIQIQPGWRCLDLGCGPRGIIGPLSRRVGSTGLVIGADVNPVMLAAARTYAEKNELGNVEFREANAYQSTLPRESFDLVHARFMFAPLGQDAVLLKEMIDLTRPGGIIVSQESDESGYVCYPPQPSWEKLKRLAVTTFAQGGGDYSAGRRTYGLWRQAGLENIQVRGTVLALPPGHPFRMWPIESALALRGRMLDSKMITEPDFDQLLKDCEQIARDPDVFLTSFVVMQVWGRKPRT